MWKDQNFSYWMTTMLHARPDASEFEDMRVRGELRNVVQSRYGRQFLAEQYTGWPSA